MKKRLLIMMGAILPSFSLFAQSYCTPPPFIDGPYTGITNVKIGSLDNSSSENDGVTYYKTVEAPKLITGTTYEMTVVTQHNLLGGFFSGNLFTHAWIDFNQDGDFEDTGERIFKVDDEFKGTYTRNVTIPEDAKTGVTRMRVYEDMPDYEGHEYPHPCGYGHYPSNPLGHHGESEDYNVEIVSATGIQENVLNANAFKVFTNNQGNIQTTYQLNVRADVTIEIYNTLGQKLAQTVLNNQSAGTYTETFSELTTNSTPFVIVHLRANEEIHSTKLIH